MELLIGQSEVDRLGHITSVRRQFYTFVGAGRARRASQRDGVRRDAVPLGESRQPPFREAPAAVEGPVDTNEVFFRVLWFAGEPLHLLARCEGDFCGFDAERVGYCCRGQGCQQMHGCVRDLTFLLREGSPSVLGPAANAATSNNGLYALKNECSA